MNLDDIIEYDEEGTNLDFKKEEYKKGNYESLIKDVMSMANAINTEPKRIVIGINHKFGDKREIIGLDEITDPAIFENIIQDNIEPTINFRYYPYKFNGKLLGIIEITDNNDKPYMMKKDYSKLKKGDTWVRKGSRQSQATREDMDRMYEVNSKSYFEKKITIGFGKELKNSIEISKTYINEDNLPSQKEIMRLKGLIKELDERNNNSEDTDSEKNPIQSASILGKNIRVGYDRMTGLPIFKDREQITEIINNVTNNYVEEDNYYIYEECSEKFNCKILNDSIEFLEEVKIELFFDPRYFIIPTEIFEEPTTNYSLFKKVKKPVIIGYPNVYTEDDTIIVEEYHKQIRHKTPTDIFSKDLRMLINPNVEIEEIEVKYRISAKNLSEHVEGILVLKIIK